MRLYMSEASPFARKVRFAAIERGLDDRIERVLLNPHDRAPELVGANPLSKVPTLVADDGSVHCDSLAICIYLDTLGNLPPLVPLGGVYGLTVLQRHVQANGLLDASVTRRMETLKSPVPDRLEWMERQKQTVHRVLDRFEQTIGEFGHVVAIDTITLACGLAYLDFRFPDDGWRAGRPRLAAWLAEIETRPGMNLTRFPS
ncbi:MAG: glutathione S-transferase N-terminal domain-containing protein [Paracoccaceae bacterium]|nr:MAG: glutathione S-transferase N-terminal domain-containing protein [Paracoccaceae bacterium]